jgi:lipid II:glycine glycyltransferase (peptidoglycan interpeptide bridge formation enzyme)
LPQTWEYGSAKASAEGWQAQRYVVYDETHVPTALFQVLVKSLPVLGGVARVNRGPLMLGDSPAGDCRLALDAIAALMREARRRRWWMVQIAPLLPPSSEVKGSLCKLGFRKQPNYPADSALLSLNDSENELLMRLNGKWRNCLRKGQKLGITVKLDHGGVRYFQWLLEFYNNQQYQKRFDGTTDKMLRALSYNQSKLYKFNLFVATEGSKITDTSVVGVLVTIQFGNVSEYVVGATNDKGRTQQANSVLLWEAILDAKRNGCRWFDVGGLSENTPKGIADFKKGLNPEPYALVGEWRRWC